MLEIAFGESTENIDGRLARESGQYGVCPLAGRRVADEIRALDMDRLATLPCIFITLEVNGQKAGVPRSTEWCRGGKWRYSERDCAYLAYAHIDIRAWARSKRVPSEQWLPLDTLTDEYARLARLVSAQIAIEYGEALDKVAALVGATGVPLDALVRAHEKGMKKGRSVSSAPRVRMDVIVRHGLYGSRGDGRGNLPLRHALGEAMVSALRRAKLGIEDGGSSGEEHFEFGFLVTDEQAAEACVRAALASLGQSADDIEIIIRTE